MFQITTPYNSLYNLITSLPEDEEKASAVPINGNNAGVPSNVIITAEQLLLATATGILINSLSSNISNSITLQLNGLTDNAASYAIQQTLNLTTTGSAATIKVSQSGLNGYINLSTDAGSASLLTSTEAIAFILIEALVVGDQTNSTILTSRLSSVDT